MSERLSLRSAYLYLVCLVTLVMAIIGTVGLARDAVQLAYPDPGYFGVEPAYGPEGGPARPSPEERERREEQAEESQRRQAVLGLVGNGALLLVAGPTYLYHWRRVQREHRVSPEAAAPPG